MHHLNFEKWWNDYNSCRIKDLVAGCTRERDSLLVEGYQLNSDHSIGCGRRGKKVGEVEGLTAEEQERRQRQRELRVSILIEYVPAMKLPGIFMT